MSYPENKYLVVSRVMNRAEQLDPNGNLGLEEKMRYVFGCPESEAPPYPTPDTSGNLQIHDSGRNEWL